MNNNIRLLFANIFLLGTLQFNLVAMQQDDDEPKTLVVDFKEKGKPAPEQLKEEEKIVIAKFAKNFATELSLEESDKYDDEVFNDEVDELTSAVKTFSIQGSSSSSSSSVPSLPTPSVVLKETLPINEKVVLKKTDLAVQDDSDSEDDEGYEYKGYESFDFPKDQSPKCMVFYRGMHFSPSTITKEQISQMRRETKTSKPIFSLAAFERANINPGSVIKDESTIEKEAIGIRKQIAELKDRDLFQELYTNNFSKFNKLLKRNYSSCEFTMIFKNFLFTKNPQLSTSEIPKHCLKYAFGKKHFESDTKILDPEYSADGKPKHPYLGKVYVIRVDLSVIKELSPYFVVHGHANKKINVFNHFANDILSEREVSFPGLIPGKYVIFEKAVRVPPFAGPYKPYYKKKYGMSSAIFYRRKQDLKGNEKSVTVDKIINKAIVHTAKLLQEHIDAECKKHNITICYKDLDDGYCDQLVSTGSAKNKRASLN